jgi:colanic acid biosynthesis glycosyl transferase WcaI
MGRVHEFSTLLDAAEKLKENLNIVFLFIGEGRQTDFIKKESLKKGLTNIILKPYQPYENLCESLGVSDCHLVTLQPALEGLVIPSKFYGAAAAGRAIFYIGDPKGELAEIVGAEKCGFAVPTGDSTALAQGIKKLAENQALRDQMGSAARALFDRRFNKRVAMASWKEVLNMLKCAHE